VFVVSFGLGVVGLAVLLLFVRNPTAEAAPHAEHPFTVRQWSGLVPRQRGLWMTLAAGGVLALVTISDAFVYLVLERRGFVEAASIPLLYVGTNATYLLLAVPLGALSDRLVRWRVFILGHLCLAVVYGALLSGTTALVVPVVLLFLGGYYASTDGVLSAMASAVLPRTDRGSGLGLLATATSLGKLGASLLFGLAWSAWGETSALRMFAGVLPVAVLVASVILARAQREIIPA
jgi:sugar phosphate permease